MRQYENYFFPDSAPSIGNIPTHWKTVKLKYAASLKSGNGITSDKIRPEGDYPVYGGNGLRGYTTDYTHDGEYILIGRQGALCGNINYTRGKFYASEHAIVVDIFDGSNSIWLRELLKSMNLNQYSIASAQPGLSVERIQNLYIPYPPFEEQTAIASYLDEKTSQLDALIEKKQKLIDLLKEERKAIINNAVSGEGKDWERKKLKYVAAIRYGLGQPPRQLDGGLPLIRATNIDHGQIVEKDLIFVDPDDVPYERDPVLKENDIIVVRSGAYTADSAIIPKKFEGAITGYDMVVRVFSAVPEYVAYALLSEDVLVGQLYLHRLRAAQPHLNKEELGETLITLPSSLVEQRDVVSKIADQIKKVDATIFKIETEIELMQEYKASLISEVVTGKVKVI